MPYRVLCREPAGQSGAPAGAAQLRHPAVGAAQGGRARADNRGAGPLERTPPNAAAQQLACTFFDTSTHSYRQMASAASTHAAQLLAWADQLCSAAAVFAAPALPLLLRAVAQVGRLKVGDTLTVLAAALTAVSEASQQPGMEAALRKVRGLPSHL